MSAQERLRDTSSEPPRLLQAGQQAANLVHQIQIGKTVTRKQADGGEILAEVFTMTIGTDTIELLPLKTWSQMDVFKWRARGILPSTPPGLEITPEHLKVAGATVSPWDFDACAKLEKALNEWLAAENKASQLAKEKSQTPSVQGSSGEQDESIVHFAVDMGTAGQPRVRCLEGNQTVKVVALNLQGFKALIEQGLMRKPNSLKVGALRDWVELDGELFRFKEGTDGAGELERALNERYIVTGETLAAQDVAIFRNSASPTGFDIQFPAAPNGFVEVRKRHLNEETIRLLQTPEQCRVLRKGMTVKLIPPNLVFKLKTPEGGECYLPQGPETMVSAVAEDGETKAIDLSQPISLLNLGVRELTAVFNHPVINRRARLAQRTAAPATQP